MNVFVLHNEFKGLSRFLELPYCSRVCGTGRSKDIALSLKLVLRVSVSCHWHMSAFEDAVQLKRNSFTFRDILEGLSHQDAEEHGLLHNQVQNFQVF